MQHIALIFSVVLFVYRVLTDNISLLPFNDLCQTTVNERAFEILFKYPPLILLGFCLSFHDPVSAFIAVMIISTICIYHFVEWWYPYLFGYWSLNEKESYERKYKHTHSFYPHIKDHPVPNTLHTVLGFLILFTAIFTILNFYNIMK
jgi:hypothetical protein